jgi:excisionase family DNA binding protein
MQYRSNLHREKLAYGVDDTSTLLSLGRTSLYEFVKSGDLRATKCGRRTLFLASDVAAFLAKLQQGDRS